MADPQKKSPPRELDLDTFWSVVAEFQLWDYTFHDEKRRWIHPDNPGAEEGYPPATLRLGDELTAKGKVEHALSLSRFPQFEGTPDKDAKFRRSYTNCCMFAEAAIIGTAYRMTWAPEFLWLPEWHKSAMYIGEPPPMAYEKAGLATLVDVKAGLEPNTYYVCQKTGHTFLILDYDPKTDQFLTLEGAPLAELRRGAGWFGGVGHRGYGRSTDRFPADWKTKAGTSLPTWKKMLPEMIAMARLHVRESAYVPSTALPYDPPGTATPPARHYYLGEAKVDGGYFPLGTQRNLHGGAHLPLDAGDGAALPRAVHALGAGDVVAARLGKGGASHAKALAASGNSDAFVLVRHRVQTDEQVRTVYALHLHLVPPGLDATRWADVPWLRRLRAQQHGAVVQVDPTQPGFLTRHWPAAGGPEGLLEGAQALGVVVEGQAKEVKLAGSGVQAVRRPAEADVTEALRALVEGDGALVTFAEPFLPVQKGELLGFVEAVPASAREHAPDEPGFLHWELLAPVTGGRSALQELLGQAEAALGLRAGFFAAVEERSKNNLLDGDELPQLVAALPGKAAPPGEWPDALKELLRAPSPELPFALPLDGPQAPAPAWLTYPVRLEVSTLVQNGKPTLAPGALTLTLDAGDGQTQTVEVKVGGETDAKVVHLPAGARLLRVSAGPDVSLDPGRRGEVAPEALAKLEVAHFERLASTRWRNVRLRHLNEWSAAGLRRSLEAREVPKAELDGLVAAVAWWGQPERAVVGKAGQEAKLFGGELPAQAELLDAVHPVTFAWLLDLLIARRKAALVAPVVHGVTPDLFALGWTPTGQPRAVGDPLWAVAVATTDASEGELTFAASKGGRRVTLGARPWAAGGAGLEVAAPLWGAWTLEAGRAATKLAPRLVIGSLTVEAPRPTISPALTVTPQKGGALRVTLDALADRPSRLHVWALLETRVEGETEWAREPVGADLVLLPPAPAPGALVLEAGYWNAGGAQAPVSRSFTYGEYCAAGGVKTGVKLAPALADAVQAVRDRTGKTSVQLKELADGVAVTLTGPPQATLAKAAADAASDPRFAGAVTEEVTLGTGKSARKALRLTVPAPAPKGLAGPLQGDFLPGDALQAALRRRGLAPGQRLEARVGVLAVDGAAPDPAAVGGGPTWEEASRGVPDDGRLEAWADAPSLKAEQAGFGPVTFELKGTQLLLRADLLGRDAAFWRGAAPRLVVDGTNVGQVDKLGTKVTASVEAETGPYSKKLVTVGATCEKTALADGTPVTVAPAPTTTVDTTRRIEGAAVREEGGLLRLEARLLGWPTDRDAEVRLLDAAGARVALPAGSVKYAAPTKTGLGAPKADGTFGATLLPAKVRAALKVAPGQPASFALEVGRPVKLAGPDWPTARVEHAFEGASQEVPVGGP